MKKLFVILSFLLCGIGNALAYDYDFEVDGIYYYVISLDEMTVGVTCPSENYTGNLVIPPTVTYNGKQFAIKEIYKIDNAFGQAITTLNSITIPFSVEKIAGLDVFDKTQKIIISDADKPIYLDDTVLDNKSGLKSWVNGQKVGCFGRSFFEVDKK